jgi:hypothetical protein
MKWRTHQLDGTRDNTVAAAEQQLAGQLGASIHDPFGPSMNVAWTETEGTDGFFNVSWVNFEQGADASDPPGLTDPLPEGNFTVDAPAPQNVQDDYIPGIPGTTLGFDYIACECLAYVEFTQTGLYEMVVNSDDGFQVSTGNASNPTFLVLDALDGGRSAEDSVFFFNVEKAGVYLFRLLYYEGNGGASVEWFTVNADGSRALLGGAQPGAVSVYRTRTVAEPELPQEATLTAAKNPDGTVVITWDIGTLVSSGTVDGTYAPVSGATSPFPVTPTAGEAVFYQVLVQ